MPIKIENTNKIKSFFFHLYNIMYDSLRLNDELKNVRTEKFDSREKIFLHHKQASVPRHFTGFISVRGSIQSGSWNGFEIWTI